MTSSLPLGLIAALFGAVSASAMPMASPSRTQSDILQAAVVCGPGWTKNPFGQCAPVKKAFVPPPANYRPPLSAYRPPPWKYPFRPATKGGKP